MKRVWLLSFLFIPVFFAACGKVDIYEKKVSFPQQQWAGSNRLRFDFTITDSSKNYYNFFVIIRHTEKYNYNNIWVNLTFLPLRDTSHTIRLNIPLAGSNGWLGAAMDDVYEQRSLVNKNPILLKPGEYHLLLQQIMREDPLKDLLQAGVRVEKVIQ